MIFSNLFLATLILMCPVRALAGGEKTAAPQSRTSAADWLRHPHEHKYYTESWTAIMEGDKGHIVFLTILYTNIGVVSGSAAVQVSVAAPGKSSKHYVYEYSTDEYGEDPKTGRIGVGSTWMALRGRTLTIHVKEADVKMDLVVKSWTDGLKLGDGKVPLDGEGRRWVQTFFHVPRGDVSGDLMLGKEEVKLRGSAYVDHWVQNVLGSDYSTRWWTGRVFHPDYTLFFMTIKTSEDFGGKLIHRLILCQRGKVLLFADDLELEAYEKREDPKGHSYDTRYKVQFSRGKQYGTAVLRGGKLFDREAILEQMNAAQRQIVRLIAGNPVTYRMRGKAKVRLVMDGEETKLEGGAIMESIVLED